MHAQQIFSSHPQVQGSVDAPLVRCIEACFDCAQACTACADACLGEAMLQDLVRCIRLNLDCADICLAAGQIASRRTGSDQTATRSVLAACEEACRLCGEECQRHSGLHEHCRVCADACRRCEDACRGALTAIH